MSSVAFFWIVAIAFAQVSSSAPGIAPAAAPLGLQCKGKISSDSCAFYLCEEERTPCDLNGYQIGFGYRYCRKFLTADTTHMSDGLKKWYVEIRKLLQENFPEGPLSNSKKDCDALKTAAFASHIESYKKSGFCQLAPLDRDIVILELKNSLLLAPQDVLTNALQILKTCESENL